MGALPKLEAGLAEVVEIDGKQMVCLPEGLQLKGKRFHVVESGSSLHLNPPRKVFTEQDWTLWLQKMQHFQQELGDFMPEGRNQPPMPADEYYPPGFFGDTEP